jgi:arginase family enzyme
MSEVEEGMTLRLLCPQWQGAGTSSIRELASVALLDWLAGTGCSRVAIHFDVDTIDSEEVVLGLGAVPGGLTSPQARRLVAMSTSGLPRGVWGT